MQEIDTLRLYVREVLRNIKNKQKEELRSQMSEERSLRKTIRKLLREKQDTTQHESTGLNALEKLLSSIVPILEVGYKDLKTELAQRKSFQAHIVRGIQNLLVTASVYFNADKKFAASQGKPVEETPPQQAAPTTSIAGNASAELKEQDETDNNAPEADPQFIDVNKKPKEEKPDPVDAFQSIETEDLTGRNFALETFKKIQKQILETYSLLSNDKDREIFYDYLLTNVKLYFDKFETELQPTPAEPTTPEYEAEKAKMDASLQGAAPQTGGEATAAPSTPEAGTAPEVAPEAPAA